MNFDRVERLAVHKVILVVDTAFSVTPDQYEPALRACTTNGRIAVVVRTQFEDLFLDRGALILARDQLTPDLMQNMDEAEEHKLAKEHLARFGDIFAIVMTQQAYDDWELLVDNEVARLLRESGAVRWVVNDLTGRAESFGRLT